MTTTQKHLPVPWNTGVSDEAHSRYDVFDANGHLVANCGGWNDSHRLDQDAVKTANAAFIILAINNHERLLEAAKAALSCLRTMYGQQFEGEDEADEPQHTTQLFLEAAIAAAAEGKKA